MIIQIGIYAIMDRWSSGEAFKLETIFDVIFNIGFLLVLVGFVVFIVSFAGCIGALRENMCLLRYHCYQEYLRFIFSYECYFRFYSLCLLVFFLAEMTLIALGFIYPNKVSEILETKLSQRAIESYRDDLDFQNIIDLVQQDLECCGMTGSLPDGSDGYRDWSKNEYFNCTKTKEENPSVER